MSNLSDLAMTFGLQNVQILPARKEDFNVPPSYFAQDPVIGGNLLGTKVYVDLTFNKGSYVDDNGNPANYYDINLQGVIISVSQQRNIVKTAIQGKSGTVKEYISQGDYSLSINGIITGTLNQYPREDVQNLKVMLNSNKPVTVTSWFLQMFDITQVVIDSYEMPQESGMYSRQTFSITALSDAAVYTIFN